MALTDPITDEQAPETFKVSFETSKGTFVVDVTRSWAPRGADRFYTAVKQGYYNDCRFFRVIEGFMAQFGIHGDPEVSAVWREARIPDDAVVESNTRGKMTFAMAGPDTRTTQLFINYKDNSFLDDQNFPPFGEVVEGMEVVDDFFMEYGEGAPNGAGPAQHLIQERGNDYLKSDFPELDYIVEAKII